MMEEDLARFLRCIGEPTRLQILKCLIKGEKCVNELIREINKEQSLISHHLGSLKKCNIVKDRQEAQRIYYKIMDDRLAKLIIDCENLVGELSLCKCGDEIPGDQEI